MASNIHLILNKDYDTGWINAIITERISSALSGTYDYKDPTLKRKHVQKV